MKTIVILSVYILLKNKTIVRTVYLNFILKGFNEFKTIIKQYIFGLKHG